MDVASCGTWRSPVKAHDCAAAARLGRVRFARDGSLWWQETHPAVDESIRVMRRSPRGRTDQVWAGKPTAEDAVPGGRCWLPVAHGGLVIAAEAGRLLHLVRSGRRPTLLTPDHVEQLPGVYTELVPGPDPREIWAIRECGRDGEVVRQVVTVPLDGNRDVRCLHATGDHLSTLRPSPDGRLLAWVSWEEPQMPWDGSQLLVGSVTSTRICDASTLMGGPVESVFQPEWASEDSLFVVSDRSRWSNLYEVGLNGQLRQLAAWSEEFGWPQVVPGLSTYGRTAGGRLVVLHGAGEWLMDVLDPRDGTVSPLGLPHTGWLPYLDTHGTMAAGVAGGRSEQAAVVLVDTDTGREEVVRPSRPAVPADLRPPAHATTFTGRDGHQVHATVFPPHSPHTAPAPDERVPYVLLLSDGPGEQHPATLETSTAFFTSRGLGVVDVHCRGSSGFGRTYREHVYGQWGVADVEDCAVVARNLVAQWNADPARLVVRGVGRGATTALAVIASSEVCAAATVYGAITDLAALEGERVRYLRAIAADSVLLRTSAWLDRVRRPVLICHNEDDPMVPKQQATLLRDALRSNAVPHACVGFRAEGHGLGRADAVAEALEAELSFYGQVLGFEPPETARLDLIAGGQESRPSVGRPSPSACWGDR